MQKQQKYPPSVASAVGGSMRGAKAGMRPQMPKDKLKLANRRKKTMMEITDNMARIVRAIEWRMEIDYE